jgi:hypothetical protein
MHLSSRESASGTGRAAVAATPGGTTANIGGEEDVPDLVVELSFSSAPPLLARLLGIARANMKNTAFAKPFSHDGSLAGGLVQAVRQGGFWRDRKTKGERGYASRWPAKISAAMRVAPMRAF